MKHILTIGLFYSMVAQAQLYGWDSNYTLPGLGRDDAVCFTLDEIVFIGTGNHGGFNESNIFYGVNTRTGNWQDVAPFPGEPRQYAIVETVGWFAYLVGGLDQASMPLKDVWQYDLVNDEWTQLSSFPGAGRWKAASFEIDGTIYYGTGLNWSGSLNDFWKYNVESGSWVQLEDIPILPRNETVAFTVYDRGYIGLGVDCTGVLHDDIWKYDPFSQSWNYQTDFPGGERFYAVAASLNGYGYVGSGEDSLGNMYNDFWEYDPSTSIWEKAENMPSPKRRGVASCSIPFKGIYFVCGLDETFQRLTDISRYTPRNLNRPPLSVFYQEDNQRVFINDLPTYSIIRLLDMRGKLMFETFEQVDHMFVDVSDWSKGVYIIWVGSQSTKIVVR